MIMSTTLTSSAQKALSEVTKKFGPSVSKGAQTGVQVATAIIVVPVVMAAAGGIVRLANLASGPLQAKFRQIKSAVQARVPAAPVPEQE